MGGSISNALSGVVDAAAKRKTYEFFTALMKKQGIQTTCLQDIALAVD